MYIASAAALFLAACGPSQSSHHASTPSPTIAVQSPSLGAAPTITVVAAGAAPSATGTVAFVVLRNPSAIDAATVKVTVTLSSSNHFADVQGSRTLARIPRNSDAALSIPVQVPNGDILETTAATAVAAGPVEGATTTTVSTGTPAFANDPIQPSAEVTLTSSADEVVDLTVICWSGSKQVFGGGEIHSLAVKASAPEPARVPLSLVDDPDHCTAYATT
jgi:hypothetical protein